MGTKNSRTRFLGAIVIACFGCLLIGSGLVYPIYYASSDRPLRAWGGLRYEHVRPIAGIVSNASPIVQVEFDASWLYDVLVEVRNFYTNGTPVVLIVSTNGDQTTTYEFYNTTSEPISEIYPFDYPNSLTLTVQYARNTTFFSGWVLVQGIQYPPMPPPPYPVFYTFFPSITGVVILCIGLYLFWIQKRLHVSRYWNQALVVCTLGVLLLSLSYPSVGSSHNRLYYHTPEYTDFGEFSGRVSASEPRLNMTLNLPNQFEVELYGFHVTTASVTIHVFSLDGTMNQSWSYVNSQYPGFQNFVFETPGDTVVEVVRETENTTFACWILANYRPVEVWLNPSGAYAPFATLFLVFGVGLFVLGAYFISKGFRDSPKATSTC